MAMARLGAIADDGVDRACLTPLDREARRLLIGWAEAAGALVSVDEAANLWARREGLRHDAPVLTGSHMDSQPMGGRFDGMTGVLLGLEVLTALHATGIQTGRPVELVAWTNEEGGRFAPGCMGSMAWAGARPLSDFVNVEDLAGVRFGDALAEQLRLESDLARRPLGHVPHAYVEVHIEQGPVLEAAEVPIGVVTGIQGARWFVVTIEGRSAHAGTTPMHLRQDAVQDFLRIGTALTAAMRDKTGLLRFTIGRITVAPNTSNSVAGRLSFTIDLRHPDAETLQTRGDQVAQVAFAAAEGAHIRVRETFTAAPRGFDPAIMAAIGCAADAAGLAHQALPSGAFHDAQFVAQICPSGMIFIPCRGGVSHHPSEYASPGSLAAGARVLAGTLLALAA